MADLNESNEDGYAGMSGMTAYNHVEGEFYLKQMPTPDEQVVKQTIQGVVDEFIYKTDEVSLQSIMQENDIVKVTESVYLGETNSVINKTLTSYDTDSSGDPFNRIVIQGGVGEYDSTLDANMSASVYDEIIAIAVEDVRPFMIKGLDIDYKSDIVNGKPTNDQYIKHLTPVDTPLIASIKSPSVLTDAGGPSRILVYYDAIDLTGEVVAGTGLVSSEVNAEMSPYHSESQKAYLIVKKTIPSASTMWDVSGTYRSLSDILLKPYTSTPSNDSDVQMEITSPGGIIDLPSADFKRPIQSHVLRTNGFGGHFPSPFINIDDCMITVKTGIQGYGRPRRIDNSNTPDKTANPTHHVMTITSNTGVDLTSHLNSKRTPASLSRSTLQVFNIIDNVITKSQHLVLVAPANHNRYAVLDDFLSLSDTTNSNLVSIEIALLRGRAEEFNTIVTGGEAELEIRGRSNLMDFTDKEIHRNLNLGESQPIKEIGDMGTPTVSLTLGGLGQGGIDAQPQWVEHPNLKGWKDKIAGSGNASVRNDRQTSTYYASTRALVELPLFPSMFYDTEEIYKEIDSITDGVHPEGKDYTLTLDCTMTAMNRIQARSYEARNAIDWGMRDSRAAIEVQKNRSSDFDDTNDYSFGLKATFPSIQAIVTGHSLTAGTSNSYIEVDDVEAFVNDTLQSNYGMGIDETTGVLTNKCHIIVGEGLVAPSTDTTLTYCTYYIMRVHKIDDSNNRIYVDKAYLRYPRNDLSLNLSTTAPRADTYIFTGATVVLGGVLVNEDVSGHTETLQINYNVNPRSELRTELRNCLGLATAGVQDLDIGNREFVEIWHHIGMNGLEWDVFNEWGSDNNRELREPIICYPNFTALKSRSQSGSVTEFVYPNIFSFRDIALTQDGFRGSVDELIRKINMAGHPLAKKADGSSAYEGHKGYARAFIGKEVESRNGEKGITVVIHSTVPGASGRNFAVWISNDSVYPYQPIQAFGYGGLLATNSRSYLANSFAAPLPIGADGETFVPITTFTGAPHGTLTHAHDSDSELRTYNGIGSRYNANTKLSGVKSNNDSYDWNTSDDKFNHMTFDSGILDYLLRSRSGYVGSGVLRVNGRYATFSSIDVNDGGDNAAGECYLIDVKPIKEPERFYQEFYDDNGDEIHQIDVEIVYPLMDSEGILFFGGGHTGLTFDISDGTDNDYSGFNKHWLAKGSTGFSGFQNLGEISSPHTIIDLTDVVNEDTINDNTLKGIHHKSHLDSNNVPQGNCAFYARLQNGLYGTDEDLGTGAVTQDASKWREDLYNRKVRVTSSSGLATEKNGVTNGTEVTPTGATPKGKLFDFGDVVALHNNNSGTVEAEHGEVKDFNPQGADFAISAVCFNNANLGHMTGPIFHAIYDDGTNNGKPYGLHLGGGATTNGNMPISVALSYPNPLTSASNHQLVSCLVPSTVSGSTVEVDATGWTFIMMGRSGSTTFLYMGNTVGITDPSDGTMSAGIFDFSDYVVNTTDQHYGAAGSSPNVKTNFETESSSYAGGDNDHPNAPTAIHAIRDLDMATIGCALLGSPYIQITSSDETQGEHACPDQTGYFTELISVVQPPPPPPPAPPPPPVVATYGVTDSSGTTGNNSGGPIHFAGYLTDVALWKKDVTFTEASTWFAGRNKW